MSDRAVLVDRQAHTNNQTDAADLMDRYRETGDIELRNELILRYQYIARTVAQQMRGITSGYAEVEDIVNQGVLTLIDCVERYDPEKEAKFETYAFLRVRGAIIDFVRKQDWRPRRVRKNAKDVAAAYDRLSNELMREPTDKEISKHLGITEKELQRHYVEQSRALVLSFENLLENAAQAEVLQSTGDVEEHPEQNLFKKELERELADAIDSLTERERLVVSLYYYENLKLAEIAEVLGVSESRVSQIHAKAINKMTTIMDKYMKG